MNQTSSSVSSDSSPVSVPLTRGGTGGSNTSRTSNQGHQSSLSLHMAPQAIPTLGSSLTPTQYRTRKVALITGKFYSSLIS